MASPLLRRNQLLLALAIVAAVGLLLYLHTLQAPWYLDDWKTIVNNRQLADRLRGADFFTPRGLALWSFALNVALSGLSLPPFHLVNIAIHIGSSWLVLLLLRRAFPAERWLPLIGALLFVAHPLQTGAVTYIVQRMTLLAALFTLAALWFGSCAWELRATGGSRRAPRYLAAYGGALLCGLFGLYCKEIAATLPLLFFSYARFFLPRMPAGWRAELVWIAPFAVAPLLYAGMVLTPAVTGGSTLTSIAAVLPLAGMEGNDPLHYLVTQFSVVWIYLRLLILPVGQVLDYGYPISKELVTLKGTAGLLGIIALLALAWRLRTLRPAIACGIAWFFVALVPESTLIPLDAIFEHRLYLPMFGFVLVVCGLLERLPRSVWRMPLTVFVLLVLGLLTWQRNRLWNEPIALFEDNLRKTPDNERVCFNLAGLYLKSDRLQEREDLLARAVQIRPGYVKAADLLSRIYFEQGRRVEALRVLEEGILANPRSGLLHSDLSVFMESIGDAKGSEEQLRIALALEPELFIANLRMGRFLGRQGAYGEAEHYVRKAIALAPNVADPHSDLASLLRLQQRFTEAQVEQEIADRISRAHPTPLPH